MSVAPVVAALFSREKLLQVARTLPADLQVLSQLGETLQDVNSELDEIANLLRRDIALAARIVRISNSPVFGGGGSIASIEDAVNRVGFSEILKLVGTATAARFAERALEIYGINAQALRDNMLFGAFAAEALAGAGGHESRTAYTAGLLRTLGMMVLDRASRGQIPLDRRYASDRWPNYTAWEGATFGTENHEVTAIILEEWRFPAQIGLAIRAHHMRRASDHDRPLAALLHVANGLVHRAQRGFVGEEDRWDITRENLRTAGLTEDDIAPAMAAAEAAFRRAIASLAV